MYDELIAALRFCDGGECDGCCRYKKEHGTECYTLLRDAADAIEELSKRSECSCWYGSIRFCAMLGKPIPEPQKEEK